MGSRLSEFYVDSHATSAHLKAELCRKPFYLPLSRSTDAAQRQLRVVLRLDGGDDDDVQVDAVHGVVVPAQRARGRAQRVGVVAGADDGAAGRRRREGVPPGVEGQQHERQQAAAIHAPSGEKKSSADIVG